MAQLVPTESGQKTIHATLEIGDSVLMGADVPPDHYHQPQGFQVTVDVHDPLEAKPVFQSLSEGGTVRMPLQKTYWAARYGALVDQFGIPWEINCGLPPA
jgi:PhnB protein